MILRIEDLKDVCSNMLHAVDSSELSRMTECLELITEDNILNLSVTNGDYFASFKLKLFDDEELHATVNAKLFLNLINKTTTETVELTIQDNSLIIKGNGEYKLPLVYEGDDLLTLKPIELQNITSTFTIPSDTLKSILKYNTLELNKGCFTDPIQKLYYVDEEGALTFTSGACVNKFSLSNKVKMLLNSNIVKLFKIFNDDDVTFKLAQDTRGEIVITKVYFSDSNFCLTAIINNSDESLSLVPVSTARKMAYESFDNVVSVSKNELVQIFERIMLFNDNKLKYYSVFEFNPDSLKIYDSTGDSFETIKYSGGSVIENTYKCAFDVQEVKLILSGYSQEYVTLKFGNNRTMVVQSNDVYCVIPECNLE